MSQSDLVPPHHRYNSYFVTTHRHRFLYWVAQLINLPVYFVSIDLILVQLMRLAEIQPETQLIPRVIVMLMAALPLFNAAFVPQHWHDGFRGRRVAIVTSAIITLAVMIKFWLSGHGDLGVQIEQTAELVIVAWGGYVLLSLFRDWRLQGLMFAGAAVFLVIVINAIQLNVIPTLLLQILDPFALFIFIMLQLSAAFFSGIWLVRTLFGPSKRPQFRIDPRFSVSARWVWGITGIGFGLFVLWSDLNTYQILIAASWALGFLLLGLNPNNSWSRQRAYWRSNWQFLRHDLLTDQSSRLVTTTEPLNRFLPAVRNFLRLDNRALYLTLAVTIGGIAIPISYFLWRSAQLDRPLPILIEWSNPSFIPSTVVVNVPTVELTSLLELFIVGGIGSLLLSALYFGVWVFVNSGRFIVSQFNVDKTNGQEHDAELRAIANIATDILVEELQKISTLLKYQQVENVNLAPGQNSAFFITSGISQDFVDQLEQTINFEVPSGGTFPVGRLLGWVLRLLARIRVNGTVQRRNNGNVEITVQFYSNQQSASVDHVIVLENSIADIDEVMMRPIARRLAIQLFVKLGQLDHLGTSYESLNEFLSGLESSVNRKWWQAISHYRRAVQIEETHTRTFGIGHYHLGTALIYQGNILEGLKHLRTAELDGPIMAETQYMLALALLYNDWRNLHHKPDVFKDITTRLINATLLKRNFAEAHHLLGTAHYRLGKLLERRASREYEPDTKTDKQYRNKNYRRAMYHYRQSEQGFRRALRYYAQTQAGYQALPYHRLASEDQRHHSTQRMTALHQVADALRSQHRYIEAETFYEDMRAIHPRNIRNLTDEAKVYCLSENWQKSEEFLWRKAFTQDITYWDADLCLHMGWTLAGGVAEHNHDLIRRLDRVIEHYVDYEPDDYARGHSHQLLRALQFFDYAVHQRPRYVLNWYQTRWYPFWEAAFKDRIKLGVAPTDFGFVFKKIDSPPNTRGVTPYEQETFLPQLWLWLALRIQSYGIFDWKATADLTEPLTQNISTPQTFIQSVRLWALQYNRDIELQINKNQHINAETKAVLTQTVHIYRETIQYRIEFKKLLFSIQKFRRAPELAINYRWLKLAMKLYSEWEGFHHKIEEWDRQKEGEKHLKQKPLFIERWMIDVYAELSLLTARALAEGGAYEWLYTVADESTEILTHWIKRWSEIYHHTSNPLDNSVDSYFTFSPRVIRYQEASLYAWRAFARYECRFDPVTRARCELQDKLPDSLRIETPRENYLDMIQEDIRLSRTHILYHPLSLYMQARVYSAKGLHEQAIDEYERLLDVILPYDPKAPVTIDQFEVYNDRQEGPPSRSRRDHMRYMEMISGRQQFYDLIDKAQIHLAIADAYRAMNRPELRAKHLSEAIRWSPYEDLDLDIFLRLANQLNNMEYYQEALSVLESARISTLQEHSWQPSFTQYQTPPIMQALVMTRSGDYHRSLNLAKQIAYNFQLKIQLPDKKFLKTLGGLKEDELDSFVRWFNQVDEKLNQFSQQGKALQTNREIVNWLSEDLQRITGEQLEAPKNLWELIETFAKQSHRYFAEPSKDRLLKVFNQLQDHPEMLDSVMCRALVLFDQELFISLLKELKSESSDDGIDFILQSQMLAFLAQESSFKMSQLAELANVLAYNRAETGIVLENAFVDSAMAFVVIYYLQAVAPRETELRRQLSHKLAQVSDTFAWVRYRYFTHTSYKTSTGVTQVEFFNLITRFFHIAIRYDQQRAIIHFHLTRVYLKEIELLASSKRPISQEFALEVERLLTQAFRHWNEARNADKFNHVHVHLAWIYNRLTEYRREWQKLQLDRLIDPPM